MKLCYMCRFSLIKLLPFFEENKNDGACKFKMSDCKEVLCSLSDPDIDYLRGNSAAALHQLGRLWIFCCPTSCLKKRFLFSYLYGHYLPLFLSHY